MAANTLAAIRNRVTSICCSSFGYTLAVDPISFAKQPSGSLDVPCVRVEATTGTTIGGMSFIADNTDQLVIWVARRTDGDPNATYNTVLVECTSLVSAITRDGATGGGDYDVPDGRTFSAQQRPGDSYLVGRLAIPVRYEAAL